MTGDLLYLPLLIPLASAIAGIVVRRHHRLRTIVFLAGLAANLAAACSLLAGLGETGFLVAFAGGWPAPFGITLVADWLGGIMVLVTAVIGFTVGIHSLRDVDRVRLDLYFHPLFHFLLMGVNGAFLTGDLFNLYVWFEVMLLSSFVLLALGSDRAQLEGSLKYVALNLLSSAIFLGAAGLLYAKVGTLNMADIARRLADHQDAALVESTALLLVVSFGLKSAIFPLFFWLPASYHTPPSAISAVFAGLLTKVGVYALIRSYTLLFNTGNEQSLELLAWLAGLTMVTGVLGAAAQYNIRKILSFHIVSQIGYMVMGLALFTPLALAATVFYLVHHIIVKTNLFLIAGWIEKRNGTGDLARLGGLYRGAPALALLFFIPAFSLGGIPPLSGFWAKFSLIKAGMDTGAYVLTGTAILVGVMTLFSMTKIWGEAFWKPAPPGEGTPAPVVGLAPMIVPVVILAALTLGISFYGEPLMALSLRAAEQLLHPQLYIEAVFPPTPSTLP